MSAGRASDGQWHDHWYYDLAPGINRDAQGAATLLRGQAETAALGAGAFRSDYQHFTPEQRPALWLCVNIVLAFTYALLIALAAELLIARRVRISGFKSGRS